MAVREHETVAVDPRRVLRVVLHHLLPEQVGDRRAAHRGARVARVGLLHHVGAEHAHKVDLTPLETVDVDGMARLLVQVDVHAVARGGTRGRLPFGRERRERQRGGQALLGRQVAKVELQDAIHWRRARGPSEGLWASRARRPRDERPALHEACGCDLQASRAPPWRSNIVFQYCLDKHRFSTLHQQRNVSDVAPAKTSAVAHPSSCYCHQPATCMWAHAPCTSDVRPLRQLRIEPA